MLCKILTAATLFLIPFSFAGKELGAARAQEAKSLTEKSKKKRGERGHRGERGPQGHRGERGTRGKPGVLGANGFQLISGVYADAFFKQNASSGPTTFSVTNGPIIFNELNQSNGVDTSQLLSNGKFIIESAGDYLISYNVYASFNTPKPHGSQIPAYIGLLVDGNVMPETIVGTAVGDPTLQMSGQVILNLNPNDYVQVAPFDEDLKSIVSLPTDSLKIASLTIQKL